MIPRSPLGDQKGSWNALLEIKEFTLRAVGFVGGVNLFQWKGGAPEKPAEITPPIYFFFNAMIPALGIF